VSTDLVVDNELGIFVEDWILSSGEWSKILEDILWMNVCWSRIHDVIGFFQQLAHTNGVTVMKIILTTTTTSTTTTQHYYY